MRECLNQICDALISSKDELNRLDQLCGDGDCGTTMSRGAEGEKYRTESDLDARDWVSLKFSRPNFPVFIRSTVENFFSYFSH